MGTDWSEVYRATYPDVVRFLFRKLWDEERARDLAQEVFVRVLTRRADNPRALVFTVALNLARDEVRTVARRRRHLTLLKNETEVTTTADALALAERAERAQAVRRALDQLNERDRDALLLWDAGLSYEEIAAQLGLSAGAVGTTLARARKRLVEAFAGTEGQKHAAL